MNPICSIWITVETSKQVCLLTKADEVSRLWHTRLGHVNYQAMTLMTKHKMVSGMPEIVQPRKVCDGCLLSKKTRKQILNKANYSANKVLDLVHDYLRGPISPATVSGFRYFFLLVDDYSRYM